jgi:hypothetical protein
MSFGGGNPIWSIAVIGPGSSFLLSRLYSRMSPTQFGLSKAFEIHFPRWSVLTSLMSMVERHSYAQNLPPLIAPLPPHQSADPGLIFILICSHQRAADPAGFGPSHWAFCLRKALPSWIQRFISLDWHWPCLESTWMCLPSLTCPTIAQAPGKQEVALFSFCPF